MSFPEFDKDFVVERNQVAGELDELCWRSQELLHSYCLDNYEATLLDETIDPPLLEIVAVPDTERIMVNEEVEENEEDEEEIEDNVYWVRTPELPIDELTVCFFDNIPLLVDDNDGLHQLLEPGFVALHLSGYGDFERMMHQKSLSGVDEFTDQIIIRLPWHHEGSAIFRGFYIDDSNRIDKDKKLQQSLANFIEDFIDLLRIDMINDTVNGVTSYAAQITPVEPMASRLLDYLKQKH